MSMSIKWLVCKSLKTSSGTVSASQFGLCPVGALKLNIVSLYLALLKLEHFKYYSSATFVSETRLLEATTEVYFQFLKTPRASVGAGGGSEPRFRACSLRAFLPRASLFFDPRCCFLSPMSSDSVDLGAISACVPSFIHSRRFAGCLLCANR